MTWFKCMGGGSSPTPPTPTGTEIEYLIDENVLILGKYVSNSSPGQLVDYNDSWTSTDYIEVTPGEVLKMAAAGDQNYNAYYDENKNWISNFDFPRGGYIEFTVPNNVHYMRLSMYTWIMEKFMIWRELS